MCIIIDLELARVIEFHNVSRVTRELARVS